MKNPILLLLAIFSIMPSFSTERHNCNIQPKGNPHQRFLEIISNRLRKRNKYNKYYESRHIDGKK